MMQTLTEFWAVSVFFVSAQASAGGHCWTMQLKQQVLALQLQHALHFNTLQS
jgi:hypothetical protein